MVGGLDTCDKIPITNTAKELMNEASVEVEDMNWYTDHPEKGPQDQKNITRDTKWGSCFLAAKRVLKVAADRELPFFPVVVGGRATDGARGYCGRQEVGGQGNQSWSSRRSRSRLLGNHVVKRDGSWTSFGIEAVRASPKSQCEEVPLIRRVRSSSSSAESQVSESASQESKDS
eukprot:4287305-Amphidinium_carterae.4